MSNGQGHFDVLKIVLYRNLVYFLAILVYQIH